MITQLVSGGIRMKSQLLYAFHYTTVWINKFQGFFGFQNVFICNVNTVLPTAF